MFSLLFATGPIHKSIDHGQGGGKSPPLQITVLVIGLLRYGSLGNCCVGKFGRSVESKR